MIEFKNGMTTRELQGLRVGVYFNINKRCYSIKAFEGESKPKVVAYASLDHFFILSNAVFKVSDSGRERVRLEKQKNVHAFIIGNYSEVLFKDRPNLESNTREITYNPYLFEGFVDINNFNVVESSSEVRFVKGKILIPNK